MAKDASTEDAAITLRRIKEGRSVWNEWARAELSKPKSRRVRIDLGDISNLDDDFQFFEFPGDVRFEKSVLGANTNFYAAKFHGDVDFTRCKFDSDAGFSDAVFHGDAIFRSVTFQRAPSFRRARFAVVPNLRDTVFEDNRVPDFFTAKISYPLAESVFLPFDWVFQRCALDDGYERFRELRRLAAASQNFDLELQSLVWELRAKRFWKFPIYTAAFWFSVVYDVFSRCGASASRPLFCLVALMYASTLAFGHVAKQPLSLNPLHWELNAAPVIASLGALLPFAGFSVTARTMVTTSLCPAPNAGSTPVPDCLQAVYLVSVLEGALAVVLLFLLGLGIKNLFRIR